MAGRREILHYILRALDSTVRDPYLTTILSGARGTGKTALMSTIADQAAGMGWVIASATSVPGMLDDLEIRVRRSAAHLLGDASRAHINPCTKLFTNQNN
jgi:ABC-type branched-subunit amino acid transport system ATPase component